ncbi:MAG TPA: ATP-binding protein, partial [Tepidisphaeraceae bacterium]|nr:ATP-binding protein [Tepidisphaeraceae bacterium]
MRRGTVNLVLVVGLLIGGLIALHSGSAGGIVHALRDLPVGQLTAVTLFILAAGTGLFGQLSVRASAGQLTKQVHDAAASGGASRVDRLHPDLASLAGAVNEVIDAAEQTVARARLAVKELEIQLKVATAERQHAEAIIYSISDAVLVTDPFDELVLANESAARTFDFNLDAASRSPVHEVLRDPKMIELIRDMRQSNSRTGRRIVEHQVRTPLGERVFKVTLSCVADQVSPEDRPVLERSGGSAGGDHNAGVVAVLHDMTREKEVAEMKNDFVSSVSHELRTPLASIKAYVEMLIDGEADDERTRREFYDVIQNEANRLSRLIDNILNISRIESGLVKINKHPQSLAVILKDAVEVIAPQAKLKGIEIVERLTPIFYQTFCDKDMLYQAVLNLLSNAVKYTPEKGIITVETTVDETNKKVVTRISDTGVGIPSAEIPFLFDKFYRVESNSHMAKGTGLGLSLVKHIVETVHKGRMFVESNVGKGSCFGFELNLCD